jgi:hypothetical protein
VSEVRDPDSAAGVDGGVARLFQSFERRASGFGGLADVRRLLLLRGRRSGLRGRLSARDATFRTPTAHRNEEKERHGDRRDSRSRPCARRFDPKRIGATGAGVCGIGVFHGAFCERIPNLEIVLLPEFTT